VSEKNTSILFWLIFALLIALRFLHFGESIDDPHSWRQCDSANMIWSFYQNGIDVLHPEVCWMGGHKQLVLEFPGVYAIIALAYDLFGASHTVARAILLLFFAAGTVYFYKVVSFITNLKLARLATVMYLLMPLGLFYSRAIQIDFSAMFFVLGMVFHYSVGFTEKRIGHVLLGSMFATLAFLTKVPYVVPAVFPLAYLILRTKDFKFVLKTIPVLLIPVVTFAIWWKHGLIVNDSAPDWSFIPTYRKFTESSHWYFGNMHQRLQSENWIKIGTRLWSEVIGLPSLILLLMAAFYKKKGLAFFLLWMLGNLIYVLIFFNLNLIHNYYQIPFLVPFAVFIAAGLIKFSELISAKNNVLEKVVTVAVLLGIGVWNFSYAEANYYKTQPYLELIGGVLEKNSNKDDLVIISYGGMDPRNPMLLYRARRNGWSIPHKDLSPTIIYKLMGQGANQLAIVSRNAPGGQGKTFTDFFPQKKFSLAGRDSLFLYQLDFKYLTPKPD
jgi:hypothetical protein